MIQQLSAEAEAEILRFGEEIARLEQGDADPDDFKRFRLENGVYGIRGSADRHMVRIRIPFGELTPGQLEAVAGLADEFTPSGAVHITTRQDFQLHNVERRRLPELLRRVAGCGLTTREACGNTVRNVTACPFAGVSTSEAFDVTPYARAVANYFLRNPINQNLPRKFKIAFEGCNEDHARIPIHDIGAVAKLRRRGGLSEKGFQIYVAGGLGAQPRSADLLEEFTPENLLIPTIEAAIRVFDRNGERRSERQPRMRARMKFLARRWGAGTLRSAILAERRLVVLTGSGRMPRSIAAPEEAAPILDRAAIEYARGERAARSEGWAIPQKQKGFNTVIVRCPLGDLDAETMRALARIARLACGGRIRASITQNLLLRWVPDEALGWVYGELERAGLAPDGAHRLIDITRCPGADTCQLALTHSRGLASALSEVFADDFADVPQVQDISVKISGCMNSCGQHHIADLGFYGATETAGGREIPAYVLLVGGGTREGYADFGKLIGKIPSRRVPEAVRQLLWVYLQNMEPGESFRTFVDRTGTGAIKETLAAFLRIPAPDGNDELLYDLGAEENVFKAEVGVGECAV